MAKCAYVGVNNIARKIKGGYVGVVSDVPVMSVTSITASNIGTHFTVTNDSYYFVGSGATFTTNNAGVSYSTAKTTLTAKSNLDIISFSYSYSSETNYDKFTLIVAGETVENGVSGATTSKTYTGSLKTGDTIVFQYAKDGSGNKNEDKCTFSDMSVSIQTGTEAKSVARRIKMAYVGVGGVARPCWGGGKLTYYGPTANLMLNRQEMLTTTVGKYALFAEGFVPAANSVGGTDTGTILIDAFSCDTITQSTLLESSEGRVSAGATTVGKYAMFCGGKAAAREEYTSAAVVFDDSLSRIWSVSYLDTNRAALGATTVGDYAVFGGGETVINNTQTTFATTDAYNSSLTKVPIPNLTYSRGRISATTVGNYALFGGGQGDSYPTSYSVVEAYDNSLTKHTVESFTTGKFSYVSTTVSNYAIFAGGYTMNWVVNSSVEVYNSSLTKVSCTDLSQKYGEGACATTLQDYAIFCGASKIITSDPNFLDVLDFSLVNTTIETPQMRYYGSAVTTGDYALFAGGKSDPYGSYALGDVQVYTVV